MPIFLWDLTSLFLCKFQCLFCAFGAIFCFVKKKLSYLSRTIKDKQLHILHSIHTLIINLNVTIFLSFSYIFRWFQFEKTSLKCIFIFFFLFEKLFNNIADYFITATPNSQTDDKKFSEKDANWHLLFTSCQLAAQFRTQWT